jgi:IS5 family transposase
MDRAAARQTYFNGRLLKNLSGDRELSYSGIAKTEARAKAQAALANLYIARRRLMAQGIGACAG